MTLHRTSIHGDDLVAISNASIIGTKSLSEEMGEAGDCDTAAKPQPDVHDAVLVFDGNKVNKDRLSVSRQMKEKQEGDLSRRRARASENVGLDVAKSKL